MGDEAGIVYIGAEVEPGDILVGKVTPKGESPMTPEEKLLRAIFGEKASDVRDTSLKVPPGVLNSIWSMRNWLKKSLERGKKLKDSNKKKNNEKKKLLKERSRNSKKESKQN